MSFFVEFNNYIHHFTIEGKPRVRVYKPRKTSNLPTIEDKLLFLLIFLKTNPLQEHHAASFGINQPKANLYIHKFIPLLGQTLKRLGELPSRRSGSLEQILQNCEDVLLDGTERPIQRPTDIEVADEHYSGKKKTHNLKNNLLSLPNLRIVWLSKTYAGKIHDKHICDREVLSLPKGIRLWQDGGFWGHKPKNAEVKMPIRKTREKPLSDLQKAQNKVIRSFRVKVEHAIGKGKIFRIIKERFRCHKLFFDDLVFEIACGINNFKISYAINY